MKLRLLVERRRRVALVEPAEEHVRGNPRFLARGLPIAVPLVDLRPVHEAVAGEGDGPGLSVAPGLESLRPLARPPEGVDVLAASNDHAVDQSGDGRRQLAGGDGDHRLVQEHEPLRDPLLAQENLPFERPREGDEVGVPEPLADSAGLLRRGARRLEVALSDMPADDRKQEKTALGAVVASVVEQPLGARQPPGPPGRLAGAEKAEAEPESRARGAGDLAGLEVRAVGALEDPHEVLIAADHPGGLGQPAELLAGQGLPPVRRGQGLVGLDEVPLLEGLAAALELGGSVGVGPARVVPARLHGFLTLHVSETAAVNIPRLSPPVERTLDETPLRCRSRSSCARPWSMPRTRPSPTPTSPSGTSPILPIPST